MGGRQPRPEATSSFGIEVRSQERAGAGGVFGFIRGRVGLLARVVVFEFIGDHIGTLGRT